MGVLVTWRDSCKKLIWQVMADNDGKDAATIRKALREAYPYGLREHYPYRVWCQEVKKAMQRVNLEPRIKDNDNKNLTLF